MQTSTTTSHAYIAVSDYPYSEILSPDKQVLSPTVNGCTDGGRSVSMARGLGIGRIHRDHHQDHQLPVLRRYASKVSKNGKQNGGDQRGAPLEDRPAGPGRDLRRTGRPEGPRRGAPRRDGADGPAEHRQMAVALDARPVLQGPKGQRGSPGAVARYYGVDG